MFSLTRNSPKVQGPVVCFMNLHLKVRSCNFVLCRLQLNVCERMRAPLNVATLLCLFQCLENCCHKMNGCTDVMVQMSGGCFLVRYGNFFS